MNAQKARGAQLDTGKMTDRGKKCLGARCSSPLFISAFRRADELAMAMECRCYRGGDGRTRLKVLRCEKQDYIDLAVCIACFAVILASRLVFPNFLKCRGRSSPFARPKENQKWFSRLCAGPERSFIKANCSLLMSKENQQKPPAISTRWIHS